MSFKQASLRLFKRMFHRNTLAVILLMVLTFVFAVKYNEHVNGKVANKNALNLLDKTVVGIQKDLTLNPKILFGAFIRGGGIDKPKQVPMPTGDFVFIGEKAIPVKQKLLYGHYDDTSEEVVATLRQLNTNKVLHEWRISFSKLHELYFDFVETLPAFYQEHAGLVRTGFVAPLLIFGDDLVAKYGTSEIGNLIRLNERNEIVWVNTHPTHHSVELGPEGYIWTCGDDTTGNPTRHLNDNIVKIDPKSGQVIHTYSLDSIFAANPRYDMRWMNRDAFDHYHLNDVQPVHDDGPYWKRGDLFLSMRDINTVLLYRPSTNRILWQNSTYWTNQHDVNIVNDSTISVYNNNVYDETTGEMPFLPPGHSRLTFYDFAADSSYSRFDDIFEEYQIISNVAGRATYKEQQQLLFLESTMQGYFTITDLDKGKTWRMGKRGSDDDLLQIMFWSRMLD